MLQPKKPVVKKTIKKKSTNPADSYPPMKDARGNATIGGGEGTTPPFTRKEMEYKKKMTGLPKGKMGKNVAKAKNGKVIKKAQNGIEKTGAVKVTDSTKPSKVVYPGYRPPRVPTTAKSKYDTEIIKKTFNDNGTIKKSKNGTSLGMKSVKAGFDKNPGVTRADIITAATKKAQNGKILPIKKSKVKSNPAFELELQKFKHKQEMDRMKLDKERKAREASYPKPNKAKSGTKVKKAFLGAIAPLAMKALPMLGGMLGGKGKSGGMGGMLGGLLGGKNGKTVKRARSGSTVKKAQMGSFVSNEFAAKNRLFPANPKPKSTSNTKLLDSSIKKGKGINAFQGKKGMLAKSGTSMKKCKYGCK
jgi:hypothetical protein